MAVKKQNNKPEGYDAVIQQYKDKYDVDSLQHPNDVANLDTMIRNQLLIEQLQTRLDTIASDTNVDPMEVKKVLDSIVALSTTNMQYEKLLGIDRKTRKADQAESFADYLVRIKTLARDFYESRLTKVMCKSCNILVGRVSAVYDATEYNAAFQCPQCKKYSTVVRKERDVFFDVKDADWRRKHLKEVIQPKRSHGPELDIIDDVVLNLEETLEYGEE